MLATLTTEPVNKAQYITNPANHKSLAQNQFIDLAINDQGQITLPKWLLEQWGIGTGSHITLISEPTTNNQNQDNNISQNGISQMKTMSLKSDNNLHHAEDFNAPLTKSIAGMFKDFDDGRDYKDMLKEAKEERLAKYYALD